MGTVRYSCTITIKLSNHPLTIVLPDIMIICDKEKLDKNQCNDAPDFIIEIVTLVNPSDDCIRKENLFISFLEIANSLNIQPSIHSHILQKKNCAFEFSVENIVFFKLRRPGYKVSIGKSQNSGFILFCCPKTGKEVPEELKKKMRKKETAHS